RRVDGRGRRRLRGARHLANGERDRHRVALGGGELADPLREALLDPLQNEAVRGEKPVPAVYAFDCERANPGVELLRRELLAESRKAALPERGNRTHAAGASGLGRRHNRRCTRIGGEGILTRRAILIHSPDRPIAGVAFISGYSKAVDENIDKMGHNAFKYKA